MIVKNNNSNVTIYKKTPEQAVVKKFQQSGQVINNLKWLRGYVVTWLRGYVIEWLRGYVIACDPVIPRSLDPVIP